MKEFKFLVLIFLMVLILSPVAGQGKVDTRNFSAKQLKNFGKAADRVGDVYSAIDFLEPYCKLRPNDDVLNYRLAQLYFASRDYQKAEKQFSKVYKEWGKDYPEALYYQAASMKSQGKYAEAKEVFSKFQRKLKSVKDPNITSS